MEPTTKKYLILTGVVVALGVTSFVLYKKGVFSSKSKSSSTSTSSSSTPASAPIADVTPSDHDTKSFTTQHVVGRYADSKS